jgi:asparagine synthase (glutamine-hydrolysing)
MFEKMFDAQAIARGYRVVLSGIGGDEVLGGIPTAGPELANYLSRLQFYRFFKQGLAWSLASRDPLPHLLWRAATFTLGLYFPALRDQRPLPRWLALRLRKLGANGTSANLTFRKRLLARPSALSNGRAWTSTVETLPNLHPGNFARYEYRYPYLDRDLVDFLFRVPRAQVTKPGRRRALMRSALKHLLPSEVLERRRKAYVSRSPLMALRESRPTVEALLAQPRMAEYGLIDATALRCEAEPVVTGSEGDKWPYLMKALVFEIWLRNNSDIFSGHHQTATMPRSSFELVERPNGLTRVTSPRPAEQISQ